MNIESLFPIAVGMGKLPKKLSAKQISFLTNQAMSSNIGNTSSVNTYVLNSKELDSLHKDLLQIVRNYFQAIYSPAADVDVYITQSWVNVTEPKQFHHEHSHQTSFLSGVLYVHADDNVDNIVFHKQSSSIGGVTVSIKPTAWNTYNSRSWWYAVNSGDVIIFPSGLNHEVPATVGKTNRVSLAFNVFLKGHLGVCDRLNELNLN